MYLSQIYELPSIHGLVQNFELHEIHHDLRRISITYRALGVESVVLRLMIVRSRALGNFRANTKILTAGIFHVIIPKISRKEGDVVTMLNVKHYIVMLYPPPTK